MKKILITILAAALVIIYIPSCYNNRADITALPTVDFLRDIVPIMTSGACGCHNNDQAQGSNYNAFPFTRIDTVRLSGGGFRIERRVDYGAIIGRIDTLKKWAYDSITHPGGGAIYFTQRQKEIIKKWIAQGPPYDGGGAACDVSGPIKYSIDIVPIYNTTCKSTGCHGGRGPVLDYPKMVAVKTTLLNMMNSGGSSGHPGGVLGITSCTVNKFKAWIEQGQPQ